MLGHDVDVPDVGVYEAIGRAEFRAGRTLDALQSAYRVGARVAWRAMLELAEGALDPRGLVLFAEAIFAYIDRLADASVAGYSREQSLLEGSVETRRHALVTLLLRDDAHDPAAGQHAAEQAGWPLPAQGGGRAWGRRSDARRSPHAGRHDRHAVDGGGVLVVPDPGGPGRQRQLALACAACPAFSDRRSRGRARTCRPGER